LLLIATGERHDALVSGGDTNPYCWLLASSDHRNGSQQPADISSHAAHLAAHPFHPSLSERRFGKLATATAATDPGGED